ncbi:hypothetical protein SAMN03159338_1477 [Sphingomonas sp. NFR04]|uniref:hypothetical protein n=1 Tax=Sphingomonas sp. NFR04 TaxID=1566283 RepID=UPI0008EFC6E8|nr:hypothetical protein [Sphingomonas sp. NFR04]SFJ47008.1 hypothetical protein SAMN03159338_1477 [Sphingomonas sp. NFR04]
MASNLICDTGRHTLSTEAINRHCHHCVMEAARQRCIERGEGWRWGVETIVVEVNRDDAAAFRVLVGSFRNARILT